MASGATANTDVAIQGTAWAAETPKKLASFRHYGWGTAVRRKSTAPADQWVHMPLVLPTYIAGTAQNIKYVEFCAQSTQGSVTKPTQIDVWANNAKIASTGISWSAGNAYGCSGVFLSPPVWEEAIGISVLLHFANATDTITLYKAWVQTVP